MPREKPVKLKEEEGIILGRVLAVALGGMLGASIRYLAGTWAQKVLGTGFPWGTALVNITGCLLIGFLMSFSMDLLRPGLRLFLVTGILGSLTTFSTFSFETVQLIEQGSLTAAMLNILSNLILGLSSVVIGSWFARLLLD